MVKSMLRKSTIILIACVVFSLMGIGTALAGLALLPAKYGGYVNDTNGNPVAWDAIEAYMNGAKRGELLKANSSPYTAGQYGLPLDNLAEIKKLLVNCPEDQDCTNTPVTFKVIVGGNSYDVQTNPPTVLWASDVLRRVDLTVPINQSAGLKGSVFLEKVNPGDIVDNQGTQVKVSQGGATVKTATSASSGYYEVTGLAAGSYSVEYSNPGGSWKKVTRQATVASDLTTMPDVTLYLGDMNADSSINILDLLWMASKIGPVTSDSQRADVNKDSQVNILDLLRVAQNIGK